MIGELGDHHLGQQPSGWDNYVDHMRRYWRLNQCFALFADPIATDMTFDGKYARCVIEFFADIFANTLEGATCQSPPGSVLSPWPVFPPSLA